MSTRVVHLQRGQVPLPIRQGLNPTRARVPQEFAGRPAIDFLWYLIDTQRHRHPDDDFQAALERFSTNEVVAVRGRVCTFLTASSALSLDDDLWFYRTPTEEPEVPFSCEIIHEDDKLIVVDKPPFLATMPRGKHITQTATVQMRRMTGIEDLAPAHRLDRLTSGVLVFTKERRYRGAYQTLFAERKANKEYDAVAAYDASIRPGTLWRNRIEKIPSVMQASIIEGTPNAETAVIDVTPLETTRNEELRRDYGAVQDLAVYRLAPHTGKTHQLRLHMYAAGVPILGDPTYPVQLPESPNTFTHPMHLIARTLSFVDPYTETLRTFTSRRSL